MPSAVTWPRSHGSRKPPGFTRDALASRRATRQQLRRLLQRRTRLHCRTQRRTQPRTASAPPRERHRNDPLR